MNKECQAYNQLVVINRGYNAFTITKDLKNLVCPVCKTGNLPGSNGEEASLEFRNIGFVNCEWAIRGILLRNKESKIYSDGRTYDNKLYTFKENNYRKMWLNMDIIVKKLNEKNNW